ncbi:hypothetical protein [Vibrio gallaecicus]|uniref:hypothetical protein n=1 Tax=Vibrio gallaecicus TaxID=552386 RepID=UPI0025B433B7|nr:hypothetical protein [Vibrio gallaecicus]MDN3617333.1 hypothetical protein [Vibrio gallaecicus]
MVSRSQKGRFVELGCQVGRMNPLSAKVLQTVVVQRMSLLSQVRFVVWVRVL